MARFLGICGFTGGFLLISPQLRQALIDRAFESVALLHQYSPFSYGVLALVAFGGVSLAVMSGSKPR